MHTETQQHAKSDMNFGLSLSAKPRCVIPVFVEILRRDLVDLHLLEVTERVGFGIFDRLILPLPFAI